MSVAIYTALYNRLASTPGVKTPSQRLKLPDEIEPSQTPFLAVIPEDQSSDFNDRGLPLKWRLRYTAYLMVFDASPSGPVTPLQTLIDAVRARLVATDAEKVPNLAARFSSQPSHTTTLGGLVSHTQIMSVETDGGALSDMNWAVAQVRIECLTT